MSNIEFKIGASISMWRNQILMKGITNYILNSINSSPNPFDYATDNGITLENIIEIGVI
jgi:hypothetical protein